MIAHSDNGAAMVRDIQEDGRKRYSQPIKKTGSEYKGYGCVDWYEFVKDEKNGS